MKKLIISLFKPDWTWVAQILLSVLLAVCFTETVFWAITVFVVSMAIQIIVMIIATVLLELATHPRKR